MVTLNLRDDCNGRVATNFKRGMTDKRFLELEITAWLTSPERKKQLEGEAYYDGYQDVTHRERLALDEDGKPIVLKNLPNNRLVNNIYAKIDVYKRQMYWPSCCSDSQYVYRWQDKPLISVNGLLAQYADWQDCTAWPQVPGALSLPKLAVKQGDPEAKTGVVGAFCRTYDIYRAMDELIPDMYLSLIHIYG